tara:strand:+ start:1184 stop:1645 length:462 start_codon:yes stop_codon:yes gene_type:complete
MNFKKKFIISFIFLSILTLAIINVKNPEKTKFYLLTSNTKEITLGNLISITFITGFAFSSFLNLLYKSNSEKILDNNFNNDENIDNSTEDNISQEFISDRPPERDIRESQPTISVNYRFVDKEEDPFISKKNKTSTKNLNRENNDWLNNNNDW